MQILKQGTISIIFNNHHIFNFLDFYSFNGLFYLYYICSAICNRVHVIDGHTACVSIQLKHKTELQQLITCMRDYRSEAQLLKLPSAPTKVMKQRKSFICLLFIIHNFMLLSVCYDFCIANYRL